MKSKLLTALRDNPGLNRNVIVLALSIFGLGLGEELWQSYLPKYLTALGASGLVVGWFSSCKDLLEACISIRAAGQVIASGVNAH